MSKNIEIGNIPAYEFEDFYPEHLAKEAADERKNGAFTILSGLPSLSSKLTSWASKGAKMLIKDEDIELMRSERRLEPFWVIDITRTINYDSEKTYRAEVENDDARNVIIDGCSQEIEVKTPKNMQIPKSFISFKVVEKCQRDILFSSVIDGMERAHLHEELLRNYLDNTKYHRKLLNSEVVEPTLLETGLMQKARKKLMETTEINERKLEENTIINRLEIYFRPVFAFEYRNKKDNRTAIIEVDGLSGAVLDSGTSWFSEKANQEKMNNLLKSVVSEIAGSLVPGGATITNLILDKK